MLLCCWVCDSSGVWDGSSKGTHSWNVHINVCIHLDVCIVCLSIQRSVIFVCVLFTWQALLIIDARGLSAFVIRNSSVTETLVFVCLWLLCVLFVNYRWHIDNDPVGILKNTSLFENGADPDILINTATHHVTCNFTHTVRASWLQDFIVIWVIWLNPNPLYIRQMAYFQ